MIGLNARPGRVSFVLGGEGRVDLAAIERQVRLLRQHGNVGRLDDLVGITANTGGRNVSVELVFHPRKRPSSRPSPRRSNGHGKAPGQAPPN